MIIAWKFSRGKHSTSSKKERTYLLYYARMACVSVPCVQIVLCYDAVGLARRKPRNEERLRGAHYGFNVHRAAGHCAKQR